MRLSTRHWFISKCTYQRSHKGFCCPQSLSSQENSDCLAVVTCTSRETHFQNLSHSRNNPRTELQSIVPVLLNQCTTLPNSTCTRAQIHTEVVQWGTHAVWAGNWVVSRVITYVLASSEALTIYCPSRSWVNMYHIFNGAVMTEFTLY